MTVTDCLDYSRVFSLIELLLHPTELRMTAFQETIHCGNMIVFTFSFHYSAKKA